MHLSKRVAIFNCFAKHTAQPVTELRYSTPFELLLAVMLSAQMTDKGVNKATEKLFLCANTPTQIVTLGLDQLETALKSINYYKTKAKNIFNTSVILIQQFNHEVPKTREDLQKLPGVGRKTANVLLSVLYQQPVIAVDTHIFRVANRTGLAKGKTPREIENKLLKNIPQKFLKNAHHWLVLHGRYVCTARKPLCHECIIRDFCEFTLTFKDKR